MENSIYQQRKIKTESQNKRHNMLNKTDTNEFLNKKSDSLHPHFELEKFKTLQVKKQNPEDCSFMELKNNEEKEISQSKNFNIIQPKYSIVRNHIDNIDETNEIAITIENNNQNKITPKFVLEIV